MRRCIQTGEVSFADASWADVSGEAKQLIRTLLRLDPSERLQPVALLRHPWVVGTGVSEVPIRDSDINLRKYQAVRRKWSTALVASMHKQAIVRKRLSERRNQEGTQERASSSGAAGATAAGGGGGGGGVVPAEHGAAAGGAGGDGAGAPLAAAAAAEAEVPREVVELLADAFKEFDPEGKGYVLEQDLAGIIRRLGQQVTPDELQQMIGALSTDGGAGGGRAQGRIHYQEYLRLASTTIQEQTEVFPAGTLIFREGDPSDYFYLIASGRVRRIVQKPPDRYANFVSAEEELGSGDYFGTSAILGSGERKRHSTMIAVTDVRVVKLGREEFEAGHTLAQRQLSSAAATRERI